MSLILDALRKLEREKDAREPGVLVVGSVPWGERSRTSRILLLAGAVAVLLLAAGVGWMLRPVQKASAVTASVPPPTTLPERPTPPPLPLAPVPGAAAATVPTTVPAPPPIRLSRPPESIRPVVPAEPTTAPASARRAAPAAPVAGAPAAAAAASEPGVAETSDPASLPTNVELSSAPPAPAAEGPAPPSAAQEAPAPAPATAGPRGPGAGPGELRLTAISQRDGRRVALINDRLVFEGDSFDGVRILRIGESEVEVEVRGEKKTLRF